MMNVCIVGYGAIGPVHAACLSRIETVSLYGICDIDKERAEEGAAKYGCIPFYCLEDCLADERIDCVHLCVPHYLHFSMIEQCVEAGKKVIAEKPITMTKEEFALLLSKYDGKAVYPVMQNRSNTCVQKLKEILDTEPELGSLKGIKGILTWCRDARYYSSSAWRGTRAFEGGGVLINQAIHILDLMIYLGGAVKCVNARTSNKSLEGIIEVEDTVDALMKFSNGATGIFYATNAYCTNSSIQLELEFENDSFRYVDGKLYRNKEQICCDESKYFGKSYWGCGHERVFYDLYVNQTAFTVGDIKNTMDAMFAIYKSAETKSVQYVKLEE